MKKQPTEWEKYLLNILVDGLVSKNIEIIHTTQKQTKLAWFKNGQRELNRHFSKYDTQITNRYVKRYLPSLSVRGIQIKTTMGYHFRSVRVTIIKKTRYTKCWPGCGKEEIFMHCWWVFFHLALLLSPSIQAGCVV